MLKLTARFVPTADEVYRMQSLRTGTDPECRRFQKFAEQGHSRQPGASRQGTYCVTPSGVLLGSINSNDPRRIADLLEKSLAKWQTLKREERLLPDDPARQLADIKRPERFYPQDGLVLNVTARDLPRDDKEAKSARADWRAVPQGARLIPRRGPVPALHRGATFPQGPSVPASEAVVRAANPAARDGRPDVRMPIVVEDRAKATVPGEPRIGAEAEQVEVERLVTPTDGRP